MMSGRGLGHTGGTLDKLEAMMRTKLEQYAKGSSKSMLHNKFR